MATRKEDQNEVSCFIKLDLGYGGYQCQGDSLEKLKNEAIVREGLTIGDPEYHDTELVCLEDGSEMKSLLMIKEHQECGHKKFFLVGPNELLPEYRAMNADRASRLYRELTADGNILESSRFWALSRRKDLETVSVVSWRLLGQRLAPLKEMDIYKNQMVAQDVLRDSKYGHSLTDEDLERMEDEAAAANAAANAAAAATAAEYDSEDTDDYDNENVHDLEDEPVARADKPSIPV